MPARSVNALARSAGSSVASSIVLSSASAARRASPPGCRLSWEISSIAWGCCGLSWVPFSRSSRAAFRCFWRSSGVAGLVPGGRGRKSCRDWAVPRWMYVEPSRALANWVFPSSSPWVNALCNSRITSARSSSVRASSLVSVALSRSSCPSFSARTRPPANAASSSTAAVLDRIRCDMRRNSVWWVRRTGFGGLCPMELGGVEHGGL